MTTRSLCLLAVMRDGLADDLKRRRVTMLGPAAGAGPRRRVGRKAAVSEVRKCGQSAAMLAVLRLIGAAPRARRRVITRSRCGESGVCDTGIIGAVACPPSSALVASGSRSDARATPATSALVARPARSTRSAGHDLARSHTNNSS